MKTAVVITDSEALSVALCRYLKYLLDMDCFYFTYDNSELMPGELVRSADIFVVELMRLYDKNIMRAEGIFVGEKLLKNGKKVLIIAADTVCQNIETPMYWDIACRESIKGKIEKLLSTNWEELKEISEKTIASLKRIYKNYLSLPTHHHHH